MISIIDYGLGNVKAFSNIFKMLNVKHEITANFDAIEKSSKLILPGVGSFDWAMHKLTSSGLKELLDKIVVEKKIPKVPLISGILITLFGGLTIYFDDPIFIYMKPTIINILFGLALMFGKYFTNEPVLKKLLGKSMPLSDEGWEILNKRWMYFFFALAILNEIIWRTQTEEFWVNFKVWGMLPITFIFTAFQIGLINKYKLNE